MCAAPKDCLAALRQPLSTRRHWLSSEVAHAVPAHPHGAVFVSALSHKDATGSTYQTFMLCRHRLDLVAHMVHTAEVRLQLYHFCPIIRTRSTTSPRHSTLCGSVKEN